MLIGCYESAPLLKQDHSLVYYSCQESGAEWSPIAFQTLHLPNHSFTAQNTAV